ncbi:MAG: tetratricopeptide repeat protein [Candidatus Coatesbacteria bacterium]
MKLKPIKPLELRKQIVIPKWVHEERLRELYELYKPAVAASGVALAVLLLFGILYIRHGSEVTQRSSQLYREALNLYNYRIPPATSDVTPLVASDEEKYVKAQNLFQQIHETYPGSRLAPEALYYVANCRFRLKQYSQALEAYDLLLSRFPRHILADQATLGKGDCLEQLSRYQESYTAYKVVIDHDGPLAYEGCLGATRCLLKLTESDSTRWSEAVEILNKLATGKSAAGARAARELRKLLADLMPKKGSASAQPAEPRPQPAATAQPAPGPQPTAAPAAQPAAAPAQPAGAQPAAPAAKP